MTIAIGFAYDRGLLFCADTGVTGDIKTTQSKIVYRSSKDRNCSFTFASSAVDLTFPLSAISKCWEAVQGMDFLARSIDEVHHVAEFSLAEFYREHIYPHPDRTPGMPYLQLLVGIWLRGETRLYLANETVLSAVDYYECIGVGAYLAKYIIGQYLKANPKANTLQDAALIARHAVQSAIDYDRNCGGIPEMLAISSDGGTENNSVGYPGEMFIDVFGTLGWKMIHDLASMTSEDQWGEKAEKRIEQFSKDVLDLDVQSKWRNV